MRLAQAIAQPPGDPPVTRKPTRAKQLGVTPDDYDRRLEAQNGHCALCPNRPKTRRLDTDHDHATLRVRGLLCHSCNRRLWSGVTADWLIRAALYVDPEGQDELARARAFAYARNAAPETL